MSDAASPKDDAPASSGKKSPQNRSLHAKHRARLAAVQCAYQWRLSEKKTTLPKLMDDVRGYLAGEEGEPTAPHAGLWHDLLHTTIAQDALQEAALTPHLSADWKMERMSPLLLALIFTAMSELTLGKTPPNVVVDEYTTLTAGFFDEPELGFVHALLARLAHAPRG